MSDFDVPGAKAAGYSDAEIADHLGKQRNFDVGAARKSGYSDAEILGHLTSAPAPSTLDKVGNAINTGVGYLGTQITKAGTGFAGQARGAADILGAVSRKVGVDPRMALMSNPVTAVGQFMPSTEQLNKFIFQPGGLPEVNSGSKVLDAGVQAGVTAPFMPGSVGRNMLPLFAGGAGSEAAGELPGIKGTAWEIPARVFGGVIGGGGVAGVQNAIGSIGQGIKNVVAPNVQETSAKILGRALDRDQLTPQQFTARQTELGPNALAVEAGGPNVDAALRGSIAAPGPARTTVNNAFDSRIEGANAQTEALINKHVSDAPPVSTRVNALEEARSKAAGPAYEAAGVPNKIEPTTTSETLPPTTRASSVLGPDGQPLQVTEPGKTVSKTTFNSPVLTGEPIKAILSDSKDVQSAISAARRLPEYKDVPSNSMIMLDKAYKHIVGMETEAIRGGNGERVRDLGHVRRQLADAIEAENPAYAEARAAFSEPSKLIDANNLGQKLFKSAVNDEAIGRTYQGMPPDQKKEFLGGVAQYLRDKMNKTDRTTAAERVTSGGENERARLAAVLGDDYAPFMRELDNLVGASQKNRAITQGSRTVPMGLEAADNSGAANALQGVVDVARGRPGTAALRFGRNALSRIGEGRTEAVNADLASTLTSTDPARVGLVASLAEKARLAELARQSGRRNALAVGAFAPSMIGNGQ